MMKTVLIGIILSICIFVVTRPQVFVIWNLADGLLRLEGKSVIYSRSTVTKRGFLLYHRIMAFNNPKRVVFRKHCKKKKIMLITSIFSISHYVFNCPKTNLCSSDVPPLLLERPRLVSNHFYLATSIPCPNQNEAEDIGHLK